MLQLSDYVKQDYLRFSMQGNANHTYSANHKYSGYTRVYFENSLFQHCAKVTQIISLNICMYATIDNYFAGYFLAFYSITKIINPSKLFFSYF